MDLKTAVRDLRKRGMTDAEIASSVGCSVSTISMWANEKRGIRGGNYMLRLYELHREKTRNEEQIPQAGAAA